MTPEFPITLPELQAALTILASAPESPEANTLRVQFAEFWNQKSRALLGGLFSQLNNDWRGKQYYDSVLCDELSLSTLRRLTLNYASNPQLLTECNIISRIETFHREEFLDLTTRVVKPYFSSNHKHFEQIVDQVYYNINSLSVAVPVLPDVSQPLDIQRLNDPFKNTTSSTIGFFTGPISLSLFSPPIAICSMTLVYLGSSFLSMPTVSTQPSSVDDESSELTDFVLEDIASPIEIIDGSEPKQEKASNSNVAKHARKSPSAPQPEQPQSQKQEARIIIDPRRKVQTEEPDTPAPEEKFLGISRHEVQQEEEAKKGKDQQGAKQVQNGEAMEYTPQYLHMEMYKRQLLDGIMMGHSNGCKIGYYTIRRNRRGNFIISPSPRNAEEAKSLVEKLIDRGSCE